MHAQFLLLIMITMLSVPPMTIKLSGTGAAKFFYRFGQSCRRGAKSLASLKPR